MHQDANFTRSAAARASRRGPEPDPVFITVEQATRRVSLGVTTIYRAFASGQLTRHKVGAKTLIRVAELDAWVAPAPASAQGTAVNPPKPGRPRKAPSPAATSFDAI